MAFIIKVNGNTHSVDVDGIRRFRTVAGETELEPPEWARARNSPWRPLQLLTP